ncbi:MAG: superoxide dismutase [Opitutales bacterium]|nr:superoxide dismutase [Opitutales bacterium]
MDRHSEPVLSHELPFDSYAAPAEAGASQPDHHPDRRRFLQMGGLAGLATLGLGGMMAPGRLSAHNHGGNAPESGAVPSIFEVPLRSDGSYALPSLPYPHDALEPYIDAETMRLHSGPHWNAARVGLNQALEKMAEIRESGAIRDYDFLPHWQRVLAFNGASYFLHLIFFGNMAPAGTSEPSEALKEKISRDFGSVDQMKAHFTRAALTVEGCGWCILGYQPMGDRMVILQVEKHQNHTLWSIIPILTLDVWEHAHYLKYQNRRGAYIDAFWNVVNWQNMEERLIAARKVAGHSA